MKSLIAPQKILTLFLTAFALANSAIANNDKAQLPDPENVELITFVFAPLGRASPRSLSQRDLLEDKACKFSTGADFEQISQVISMLRSNIVEEPEGVERIDLRSLVFIHLKNGNIVRVMLGEPQGRNRKTPGGIDDSRAGSHTPVLGEPIVSNEIRAWVKKNLIKSPVKIACLAEIAP